MSGHDKKENIMPKKNTKTAKPSKRRTKVKELGTAKNLDATETKKVRGGVYPGGVNVLMADGSVRFVSSSIQDGTSNTILDGAKK